jgi:hypothetical protein
MLSRRVYGKSRNKILCFISACLVGFSNLEAAVKVEKKATEVLVVATQHFITDMPEGYTPGHLRALLESISPDIVAIEAPNNVPNPWAFMSFELRNVTKPWADKRKIQAIPVGYHQAQYNIQLGAMFQAFQAAGKMEDYRSIEQNFQSLSAARQLTCEFVNSRQQDKLWREYHAALHKLYGQDTPWEDWNKKIVSNVIHFCRKSKGKRIAVVFGTAHCYYIKDSLEKEDGIILIPNEKFFPLSAKEVEIHTLPKDYLLALRLLNFQNYGNIPIATLTKLEGSLEKVKKFPQFQHDYKLFKGKLLLHRLKPQEALTEFQELANLDPQQVSMFDGQSRLRETSLVFVAIAKMQMGKDAEARQDLEAVVNMQDVTTATKQWAEQILNNIPE